MLSLLCADGKLFQELDDVTCQRIAVLVSDQVDKVDIAVEHIQFSHPASLFVSLLKGNGEQFVLEKLGPQLEAFLERFPYSAYFTSNVAPFGGARSRLLAQLNLNASSADFGTANAFVRHVGDIEKLLGDSLLPSEALKLLVGVIRAAEIGAFSSIDLRNARFGSVPKLRSLALEYIASDVATARSVAAPILGLPEDKVDAALQHLQPSAPT